MRKSLMAIIAVMLLVAAAPALAQLDGDWKGQGKGVCSPPPFWPNDIPIYAWQTWTGTTKGDDFFGSWKDETGKYGNFSGKILWISESQAYAEGTWTWVYNPDVDPPQEYEMGPFQMTFDYFPVETPYCNGKWQTDYSNEGGSMKGRMIF